METPIENVGKNKLCSINMLMKQSNIILQKKVFKLVRPKQFNIIKQTDNQLEEDPERFVQIKIHSTIIDDQN
jgi:hypothetical protein